MWKPYTAVTTENHTYHHTHDQVNETLNQFIKALLIKVWCIATYYICQNFLIYAIAMW